MLDLSVLCCAAKEDTSVAMEELCLMLRLAAHVLADPGEGETPMIPLSLTHASSACAAAGQVVTHSMWNISQRVHHPGPV